MGSSWIPASVRAQSRWWGEVGCWGREGLTDRVWWGVSLYPPAWFKVEIPTRHFGLQKIKMYHLSRLFYWWTATQSSNSFQTGQRASKGTAPFHTRSPALPSPSYRFTEELGRGISSLMTDDERLKVWATPGQPLIPVKPSNGSGAARGYGCGEWRRAPGPAGPDWRRRGGAGPSGAAGLLRATATAAGRLPADRKVRDERKEESGAFFFFLSTSPLRGGANAVCGRSRRAAAADSSARSRDHAAAPPFPSAAARRPPAFHCVRQRPRAPPPDSGPAPFFFLLAHFRPPPPPLASLRGLGRVKKQQPPFCLCVSDGGRERESQRPSGRGEPGGGQRRETQGPDQGTGRAARNRAARPLLSPFSFPSLSPLLFFFSLFRPI